MLEWMEYRSIEEWPRENPPPKTNRGTRLLTKQGDLEVILPINGESVVWLFPAADPNATEYFFIPRRRVDLAMDDGLVTLGPGIRLPSPGSRGMCL